MTSEPLPIQSIITDDGSLTCRHPVYGEPYHALQGARTEAESKFILPSRLAERLRQGPLRLLDVGFGLGVNCRAAAQTARQTGGHILSVDTVEADPDAWLRARTLYPECRLTRELTETGRYQDHFVQVTRHDGDLRQGLTHMEGPWDVVFHDPFSPLKNTECWTLDLFRLFFQKLSPDGLLLTYSESAAVRAGLLQAGFLIGTSPAVPPHRGGTLAARAPHQLTHPLDPSPFQIFPKNVPFRDQALADSGHSIRARREASVRSAVQ